MADRDRVVQFCDETLQADQYKDIALNGLQIEGTPEVQRIAVAVSCNQWTIDAAVDQQADTILVHHGLVLNNQVGHIVGPVRKRLKGILANDINLIGYHLPLDGHPELGNNAQIMAELGLQSVDALEVFGPMPVGYVAETPSPQHLSEITSRLEGLTGQRVIVLPGGDEPVRRVAVLSGSGYPALEEAMEKGCQVLITGDAREPTMAMARELGITVLVGGHEATERLGVQTLADRLKQEFGIEYSFVPDPNPL